MKTISNLDSPDWIDRFRNGDELSLREIYDHFAGSLFLFSKKIVGNDEDAKELTSEAFVRLWQRRESFAEIKNIKAFLFIITRNASLSHVKKTKNLLRSTKAYEYQLTNKEEAVLNKIILNEFMSLVHAEIELLPDVAKKVFSLVYIEGLETAEIAKKLDMHPKTVRNNKDRALSLLRIYLLKKDITISAVLSWSLIHLFS